SCDNIVDTIDSISLPAGVPGSYTSVPHHIAAGLRRHIERTSEDLGIASWAARRRMSYRAHKLPGLTEQFVDLHIARFATVFERFEPMRARRIESHIFSSE